VASAPEVAKYSSSTSKASQSLASDGTNLVRGRVGVRVGVRGGVRGGAGVKLGLGLGLGDEPAKTEVLLEIGCAIGHGSAKGDEEREHDSLA